MANWGEFIREFKILNLKSQGIYCKVDEVLDLYDERAKLREELAALREQLAQAGQSGDVREQCARELEEYAQAVANEPDQPEYIASVLQAAAGLIRSAGQAPVGEAAEGEEAPLAEPVEGDATPLVEAAPADPLAPAQTLTGDEVDVTADYLQSVEIPPPAEAVAAPEPVPPGEDRTA
jgi:hypothetical protein